LEVNTKEALDSSDWLNISSDSILEFLKMEWLNISEADLVRSLMKWGKFQLQQVESDTTENLRSKILPGLRHIRFDSLTQHEIAQLCKEEFETVLTGDEKCAILMSIITGDWKSMPTDVVPATKPAPRHGPFVFFSLPYEADPARNHEKYGKNYVPISFTFKINKKATIVGVKLNLNAYYHDSLTSITLTEGKTILGKGNPRLMSFYRGETFCAIKAVQSLCLTAGTEYTVTFEFSLLNGAKARYYLYTLPGDKNPSLSGDLALHVDELHHTLHVHVQGIVFEKERSV
jgi:hypothetical protein